LAAGIGSCEEEILPSDGDSSQRPLGSTDIDFEPAIIKAPIERTPTGERMADCAGGPAFG